MEIKNSTIREVLFSDEFVSYFENLDERTRDKYAYVIEIIRTQYVISEKFIKMILDDKKLAKLKNSDKMLSKYYGEIGSIKRIEFEAKAKAWYYAELLKEVRKKEKVTQQELAEKIGKKREYVALLEKGETDMQLSTFISITEALGLQLSIV